MRKKSESKELSQIQINMKLNTIIKQGTRAYQEPFYLYRKIFKRITECIITSYLNISNNKTNDAEVRKTAVTNLRQAIKQHSKTRSKCGYG